MLQRIFHSKLFYLCLETGEKVDKEGMPHGVGHFKYSLLSQEWLYFISSNNISFLQSFDGEVLSCVPVSGQDYLSKVTSTKHCYEVEAVQSHAGVLSDGLWWSLVDGDWRRLLLRMLRMLRLHWRTVSRFVMIETSRAILSWSRGGHCLWTWKRRWISFMSTNQRRVFTWVGHPDHRGESLLLESIFRFWWVGGADDHAGGVVVGSINGEGFIWWHHNCVCWSVRLLRRWCDLLGGMSSLPTTLLVWKTWFLTTNQMLELSYFNQSEVSDYLTKVPWLKFRNFGDDMMMMMFLVVVVLVSPLSVWWSWSVWWSLLEIVSRDWLVSIIRLIKIQSLRSGNKSCSEHKLQFTQLFSNVSAMQNSLPTHYIKSEPWHWLSETSNQVTPIQQVID